MTVVACSAVPPATPPPTQVASASTEPADSQPLNFQQGDFDQALLAARNSGKLLFVDAWAPWCHTCLSMRETVWNRRELGRFASQFEFLEIDTDKPEALSFVERYPLRVWPTFLVFDPVTREIVASYGGSMSLEETASFLERAAVSKATPEPGHNELALAHREAQLGNYANAESSYRRAAALLPAGVSKEAVAGLLQMLVAQKQHDRCVDEGVALSDNVRGSSARVDVLLQILRCSSEADAAHKEAGQRHVSERLPRLIEQPAEGASVDDRSDAMGAWAEWLDQQGRKAEARALQEKRLQLLESTALAADTPAQAQVHDYQRMLTYLALGRGEEAVTMLEARCKEFPDNYEPPARLAFTLIELGRYEAALAPLARTLELSYGPRKLRYLAMQSKALGKLGRHAEALASLQEELQAFRALPLKLQDDRRRKELEARLEAAQRALPSQPAR